MKYVKLFRCLCFTGNYETGRHNEEAVLRVSGLLLCSFIVIAISRRFLMRCVWISLFNSKNRKRKMICDGRNKNKQQSRNEIKAGRSPCRMRGPIGVNFWLYARGLNNNVINTMVNTHSQWQTEATKNAWRHASVRAPTEAPLEQTHGPRGACVRKWPHILRHSQRTAFVTSCDPTSRITVE